MNGVERPVTQEKPSVCQQTVVGRTPGPRQSSLGQRLRDGSVRNEVTGCLIWQRCKSSKGYGCISIDGRIELVHRIAYRVWIGPIPDGLTIDHVWARGCRSTLCIEPAHLEAVTPLENIRRGAPSRKTHCLRNHPLSGRNLRVNKNGHRSCLACARGEGALPSHDAERAAS